MSRRRGMGKIISDCGFRIADLQKFSVFSISNEFNGFKDFN